jgi:serine/threonine protein kinase
VAGESSGQASWILAALAPGAALGGFRIESRLGAGGMAVVFRARDEGLERIVALKVLAPAFTEDTEFRERFIRESRAAARVDHPHIIPVHAAGDTGGVLYLAMRFVPGGDLRAVIQREGPLTAERTAALLSPIASALDAAHAAGLVHRDVKPANILIDTSPGRPDHPYLADFGLAKGASSTTGLTETGQFLGTPDYAAPEQISGRPAGPQTDQYALACVAYTMLTGSLLFARGASMAVLWAHMYDPPPSVSARRRDQPVQVSGRSGWEVTYDVTYPNAAAQGATWTDEQAAVVVVDTGTDKPAVFFTSVPSTLNEADVTTLVSSLQLTSARSPTGKATSKAIGSLSGASGTVLRRPW